VQVSVSTKNVVQTLTLIETKDLKKKCSAVLVDAVETASTAVTVSCGEFI